MTCINPVGYAFTISAVVLVQSLLVSGYTSSIVTTLEKAYNLWSRQVGYVVSSYDVSSMLAVLAVSYLGDRHNRAQWIGKGCLLISVGSVLFASTHFLFKSNYQEVNSTLTSSLLCNSTAEVSAACPSQDITSVKSSDWPVVVFVIAKLMIGVGASPIYTLGPTYLYDNVPNKSYPLYAGIMYSMTALGPALGFFLGAICLQLYIVPWQRPSNLNEDSPEWIGAWWVGYLVSATLILCAGIPLLCYPPVLKDVDNSSTSITANVSVKRFTSLKDFTKELHSIFTNTLWIIVTLIMIVEQSMITGFVLFIAKYIQITYDQTAASANIYTGAVVIPGAIAGILLGSVLMRLLSPSCRRISHLLCVFGSAPLCGVVALLYVSCDRSTTVNLASLRGFSIANESTEPLMSCHNCACQPIYAPVCVLNTSTTFMNACQAGCLSKHHDTQTYTECGCELYTASKGRCASSCDNLTPFLVILFFTLLTNLCGQNPILLLTLRSMKDHQRSFGLGIQNFLSRILALIPSPIYFGVLFDSTCSIWYETCGEKGTCYEYDVQLLASRLFGLCIGLKCASLCLLVALVLYFECGSSSTDTDTCPSVEVISISNISDL